MIYGVSFGVRILSVKSASYVLCSYFNSSGLPYIVCAREIFTQLRLWFDDVSIELQRAVNVLSATTILG